MAPQGTLQVVLVSAKALEDSDIFSEMDPYCILTCRTQDHKSGVARGAGCQAEWNETFVFNISGSVSELKIKIMDKDTFSEDDFVGQATIPLEPVFREGTMEPTSFNVVKGDKYHGEIKVGLTFTSQMQGGRDRECDQEESYGGWKESGRDY